MDLAELTKAIGIDLVKDAPDLEPVEGEFKFKIFARDHSGKGMALKTWIEKGATPEAEDEMFLSGIASSTIKDLHGDTMLPSALIDMEKAAQNNLTIFGNHKYEVPEDVFGSVVKASLSDSGVTDSTGQPIYDLNFEKLRINRRNKRAVESWRSMDDGTKLGLSIGAKIPEGGAIRNKKTGALLIAHVELLETSVVGIPANPRSWIDSVSKSIKSGPEPLLTAAVAGSLDVEDAFPPAKGDGKCPDCGKGKDASGCNNNFHKKDVTPETIVGDDTIVAASDPSTNTDSPPQAALASAPENDGAVATPDVIAAATDVLARGSDAEVPEELKELLVGAHNALATVTNQLIEVDAAKAVALQRAETAETERDEMRVNTENVIREVANLITKVGDLPAGRVASFKAIQRDAGQIAEDFEGLGFTPEVARMLRSPKE